MILLKSPNSLYGMVPAAIPGAARVGRLSTHGRVYR